MDQPPHADPSFCMAAILAAIGTATLLLALMGSSAVDLRAVLVHHVPARTYVMAPVGKPLVAPLSRRRFARGTLLVAAAAEDAGLSASPLVHIDADNFMAIVSGPTPVLIDYAATWCGPCKLMESKVMEVAQKHQGRLKVYKMDCEAHRDKCVELGIQALPTLQVWRNGERLDQMTGTNRDRFEQLVQAALA